MSNVINKAFQYGTPAHSIGNPEDEAADDVNDPQTVISLLKKLILVGSLEAAAALGHRVTLLEQQMDALTERVTALEAEKTADDTWQTNTTVAINALTTRVAAIEVNEGLGASLRFEYTYDSGIISPPSAAQLRLNNVAPNSASKIWLHNNDADGNPQTNFIRLPDNGMLLLIQDKADATKWNRYKLTAAPITNQATYVEYTVQWQQQGATPMTTGNRVVAFFYRAIT